MAKDKLEINIILGKNIRKYRQLRGLSQEELMEKIEIDPSSMSDIECGKRQPKPETLMKIVKVLNISYSELYEENSLPLNAEEDFLRRYELIKNNPEKFNIALSVLKALT